MMIRQDVTPKYSLHNKLTRSLIYEAVLVQLITFNKIATCAPSGGVAITWHLWPLSYPQPEEKMRPQIKKQELWVQSLLPGLVRGKQFPRYTLAHPRS